jgi:hypothetical protein
VRLIIERKFGQMVTYWPPDMGNCSLLDAIKLSSVNPKCSAVQAARALGVCFGDDNKAAPWSYKPEADANGNCEPCNTSFMGLPKPNVPAH